MKKKNGKKKFNNFKKVLKNFMSDEQGYIKKENILKIGLGTISALGILSSISDLPAQTHAAHAAHVNQPYVTQVEVAGTSCYKFAASHGAHASHSSTVIAHSSY